MLRVSHVFIPNSRQTMGTKSQRPWFVTDSKKPKLSDAPRIARAIRASPKQTMKQIVWGLQTTFTSFKGSGVCNFPQNCVKHP